MINLMNNTGGLTAIGITWDRVIANKIHRELKMRGYTNIRVLVINGRWCATATVPGGIKSENFKIKN